MTVTPLTAPIAHAPPTVTGEDGTQLARVQSTEPRPALLGPYLGYIGYFVGAGLISGAVVHHPLAPTRYSAIAAAGVAVFLTATVLNEFVLPRTRPTAAHLARVVGASLLLSFGIGMVSGGLQHFADFPSRSAVLVPAGLLLSYAAYVLRHAPHQWRGALGVRGLAVLAAAAVAFVLLNYLATGHLLPGGVELPTGSDGHGH